MTGQSLPGIGVSLGVGVSLTPNTNILAWSGESLLGVGVSIVPITPSGSGATVFDFSKVAQSQYIPIVLGGFG